MSRFRKISKRLLPPNQKISENNAKSSEYDSLQVFLEFHEKTFNPIATRAQLLPI